jgi:hypothetical protein
MEEKPEDLTPISAVLDKLGLKFKEELRIVFVIFYLPTAS